MLSKIMDFGEATISRYESNPYKTKHMIICCVAITGLVYAHHDMGALSLGHRAIMELRGINVKESYNYNFDYPTYVIYPNEEDESKDLLSETENNILKRVCDKFKDFTGKQIADYMHQETAYTNTRDKEIITFSYAKEIREF